MVGLFVCCCLFVWGVFVCLLFVWGVFVFQTLSMHRGVCVNCDKFEIHRFFGLDLKNKNKFSIAFTQSLPSIQHENIE